MSNNNNVCKYCNKSGAWILEEVLRELIETTANDILNRQLNREQIDSAVGFLLDEKLSELIDNAINYALYEK